MLLESFGTPPETGVQPLLQVDIVAFVSTKGIEEFVSSLQPGENQHDEEQLRRERGYIWSWRECLPHLMSGDCEDDQRSCRGCSGVLVTVMISVLSSNQGDDQPAYHGQPDCLTQNREIRNIINVGFSTVTSSSYSYCLGQM